MAFNFNDILRSLSGQSPTSGSSASLKPKAKSGVLGTADFIGPQRPVASPVMGPPGPPPGYTSGGSGATNNAPTTPTDNQNYGQDLALAQWNAARQQAQDVRSQGQSTFDTIMKSIQDFRDRAQTNFNNAGQQITNGASDILGTNATNAQQLAGTLNAQGRSLGLSSKLNLGQKLLSGLAGTQGNILAKQGEQNAANRADLTTNNANADTQGQQANTYLQGINNSANQVESAGAQNYGGALNNILDYQRSLAAINPLSANSASAFNPSFSGIQNNLNQVLSGLNVGGGAQNTADQFANPVSPTDIYSRLKAQGLVN